jgi:hypothetical protein
MEDVRRYGVESRTVVFGGVGRVLFLIRLYLSLSLSLGPRFSEVKET